MGSAAKSSGHSASLPVRGAWVEMPCEPRIVAGLMSLPVRGAWVEINCSGLMFWASPTSLPVRGAWVEIAGTS